MTRNKTVVEALVEAHIFPTKDAAKRAVMAGLVSACGKRFDHPGDVVSEREMARLHVKAGRTWASRGGDKLAGAFDEAGVEIAGKRCLDMGCSSGGFSDVLLARGAVSVVAVDVGKAQFSWRLRQDERVELLENTKGQSLLQDEKRENTVDVAVCDVSFCSATSVVDAIAWMLVDGGWALILVKPQFEAPKEDVGEGGVVTSERVQKAACDKVVRFMESRGFTCRDVIPSPIKGTSGNQEFFVVATLKK